MYKEMKKIVEVRNKHRNGDEFLKTMQSETHIYIFWPKKHIRFMGSMWNLFDNQSLKDSQNSFDTGHSHMYQ
jgi:hypothetical protein